MNNKVFLTGGSGYIGSFLIPELITSGFQVTALARESSYDKLSNSVAKVTGSALDAGSYASNVTGHDTFIHLVGVSHPGPHKGNEFRSIDLVSVQEAVKAAASSGVKHFIYLSVAQPSPVMKEYIEVRIKGEELLGQSSMNVSIARPWYVLGPGHRWAAVLKPIYSILKLIPGTSETARRLDLIGIDQFVRALVHMAKNPPSGMRIYEVPEMKKL